MPPGGAGMSPGERGDRRRPAAARRRPVPPPRRAPAPRRTRGSIASRARWPGSEREVAGAPRGAGGAARAARRLRATRRLTPFSALDAHGAGELAAEVLLGPGDPDGQRPAERLAVGARVSVTPGTIPRSAR